LRRAARWDGFCGGKEHALDEPWCLTPAELQDIKAAIAHHRSVPLTFDLALGGAERGEDWEHERTTIKALAEAGATWWMEYIGVRTREETAERIARGPLRIDYAGRMQGCVFDPFQRSLSSLADDEGLHLGQFPAVRPAVDRRDLLFGETEVKLRIHTAHPCRKVCQGKHPIDLDVQFHRHFLFSQNAQGLTAFPVILPQRPTLFKGTQAVIDASLLILVGTSLARSFPG
jgi:hypothetical protein